VEAYGHGEFNGYGSGHDFYGVRLLRVHESVCVCACWMCTNEERQSERESMRTDRYR
jgi:hypothetical protein